MELRLEQLKRRQDEGPGVGFGHMFVCESLLLLGLLGGFVGCGRCYVGRDQMPFDLGGLQISEPGGANDR